MWQKITRQILQNVIFVHMYNAYTMYVHMCMKSLLLNSALHNFRLIELTALSSIAQLFGKSIDLLRLDNQA